MRYTRQHYQDGYGEGPNDVTDFYNSREKEYLCGGGLLIARNNFTANAAVIHASHGGAVAIECDFMAPEVEVSRAALSPKRLTSEIPYSKVSVVRFFDSMRDATNRLFPYKDGLLFGEIVIQENDFDSNEAGQKGSAIYTRQIGNLLITGNTIRNN